MAQDPNATGSAPSGKRRFSKRAPGGEPSQRNNRDIARLIVFGLGLIFLIAFIIANSASVRVRFVVFDTRASLVWVIVVSALLGVLVDRLAIVLRKRRASKPKD
jgi:uncharacterized integral membrane protein